MMRRIVESGKLVCLCGIESGDEEEEKYDGSLEREEDVCSERLNWSEKRWNPEMFLEDRFSGLYLRLFEKEEAVRSRNAVRRRLIGGCFQKDTIELRGGTLNTKVCDCRKLRVVRIQQSRTSQFE